MLLPIAAPSDVSESPSLCSHLGGFRFRILLGYQSTRAAGTFTPRHIYRNLKLPPGAFSPGSGFPRWNLCMPTPDHFTLGLLPERRMDWRTLATSYGFEILVIILLINVGFIWPERLQLAQDYRVTEIIPIPSLQPKAFKPKTPPPVLRAKLLQTGGFGDPNGIPGQGKPNAHLTMANTGSFDLPPGAGMGNGTGGTKGIKGTIASAGFGAQQVAPGGTKPQQTVESGPPTTPVEITYKSNPIYTNEARQLKLEGEVLLELMFGANGQIHVNRVVRGMGHGLDEAATAAAGKIRFKPALRNGVPIDSTAVVHVVFQLAY